MAKEKATITLDRATLDEARRLAGTATTSATIDAALHALIRAERLRRDLAAYGALPPTDDEVALGVLERDHSDLADDTDWAALYTEAG
jgi:hypothetical protein